MSDNKAIEVIEKPTPPAKIDRLRMRCYILGYMKWKSLPNNKFENEGRIFEVNDLLNMSEMKFLKRLTGLTTVQTDKNK